MKRAMGVFMGAHRLRFDVRAFQARDDPTDPTSRVAFDPVLYRGFKLALIVSFRATELVGDKATWTGGPDARHVAETSRLTVGVAYTPDRSFVYATPKHYQRAGRLRPYSIGREARRGFNRLRKNCEFMTFLPDNALSAGDLRIEARP